MPEPNPQPIAERLTAGASPSDAAAAVAAYAADRFAAVTLTRADAEAEGAAFAARLLAGETAGLVLAAAVADDPAERERAAHVLEVLAFAAARQLRDREAARGLDGELSARGGVLGWLTRPGLRRLRARLRRVAGSSFEAAAGSLEAAETGRALTERVKRWRPDRREPSAARMVAEAIDATYPRAPRRERDAAAAALVGEVLGVDTTPDRVRETMKPHRRLHEIT